MKKTVLLIIISLASAIILNAQQFPANNGAAICSQRKMINTHLLEKSFQSANTNGHAFDVLNYTITIDLVNCLKSPYPNSFSADVKILFRVDSTLNQIVLDADNKSLAIDSVRLNGTSYIHSGNKLTIQLDRSYSKDEQAKVRGFYKHT